MNTTTLKNIAFTSIIAALVLMALLIVGCTSEIGQSPGQGGLALSNPDSFNPHGTITTQNFKSVDQYNAFLRNHQSNNYGNYGYGLPMLRGSNMIADAAMVAEAAPAKATGVPSQDDFSGTNNQVASVDEGDLLKTDGTFIYTITGKTLYVIKAYPGEQARIVSTIAFDDRPSELFINGDRLTVFGTMQDLEWFKEHDIRVRQGMTFVNTYDVSDRSNPVLIKEYAFEGNYYKSRMVDRFVYVLTRTQPVYRPQYPTPIIMEDGVVRSMPVSDIAFFPLPYRQPQLVTVHAFDLNDLDAPVAAESVMVESGQNVYMSEDNIYLTYSEYVDEWKLQQGIMMDLLEGELTDADRSYIAKVKAADPELLSKAEKDSKIFNVYQQYLNFMPEKERESFRDKVDGLLEKKLKSLGHLDFTVINKLSVSGKDIETVANGKVPGTIINQFSMDEQDGLFRIATTTQSRWNRFLKERQESKNSIYILDNRLAQVGSLEDLAEGERIFSTRFIDDRLYMVTFRRVDPFFVIDLSDPANPKKLGELKIPGFSRYLHPYDKNIIIGIGQDATEQGRTKGLKISLFDVSDVSAPKEIAHWVSDERYAQSSAQSEHRAFLFSKEKELLVIPVWNYDYRNQEDSYNGAMVFHINEKGIELRGLIDHSQGQKRYGPAVERSLYIDDLLYTKSANLLRINRLTDLGSVKRIELTSKGKIPIY
ncbi:MAG: hypothetical protein GXP63_06300 [DPANN group archaeon]|nr:hypothetical protein [DPANN group archaeon]